MLINQRICNAYALFLSKSMVIQSSRTCISYPLPILVEGYCGGLGGLFDRAINRFVAADDVNGERLVLVISVA